MAAYAARVLGLEHLRQLNATLVALYKLYTKLLLQAVYRSFERLTRSPALENRINNTIEHWGGEGVAYHTVH